jgi:hypothetical protein
MSTKKLRLQTPSSRRFAHSALCALSLIVLAGCASTTSTTAPTAALNTPEALQKRAMERSTERWKALTDKRFDDSYGFLSEASKATVTAAEYTGAMRRMGYTAAVIESATCDDQGVCIVKSKITLPIFVRNVGARLQTLPVEERWIMNSRELWLIRQ